jgi:hypothetical protein
LDCPNGLRSTHGDFFETVPDAGLYLLKMIPHDWDDEQSIRILRNCRASVRVGGSALIAEMVIDELDGSNKATRADMNMLSVTDGGMAACRRSGRC